MNQDITQNGDIPYHSFHIGGMRDCRLFRREFEGGKERIPSLADIRVVRDNLFHPLEKSRALVHRQIGELVVNIVGAGELVLFQHSENAQLVVRQPRIALIAAQEFEHQLALIRSFVDITKAIKAAEIGFLEICRIVDDRRHILNHPPIIFVICRVQESSKTVNG